MTRAARPGTARRSRGVRLLWLLLAVLLGVLGVRAVTAGAVLGEAAETAELDPPVEDAEGTVTGLRRLAGVDLVELAVAVRGGAVRTVLLPSPSTPPAVGDVVALGVSTVGDETVSFVDPAFRVDVEGRTDPALRAVVATRAERLYWGGLAVAALAAFASIVVVDRLLR